MCSLAFAYSLLMIWSALFRNPASTVYIYDSLPGYIILSIRMATLGWFMQCLKKTFSDEFDDGKRRFYIQFGTAYTLWFLYLPVVVIISATLDAWVRMKTVVALYSLMNAAAFASLVYMLWPTRAAKYFRISGPDLMGSGSGGSDGL